MTSCPDCTPKAPVIIFDFDGTLADTLEEALLIVNTLAPKYGFPVIDDEKVQRLRGLSAREVIREVGIRPRSIPSFLRDLKGELRSRLDRIRPIEGIRESLEKLKAAGITMGILTSNSRENVEIFLERTGLRECFAFLRSGSSLFGKARNLRRIIEKELPGGLKDARRVIYVGDEIRDVLAAKRAGVRAVAVCWGANSREALEACEPDLLLEEPSELPAIVESAEWD
ncbi:MAG: HAD hydrolase-like protein [Verrucomicrobiales bacterium]